MKLKKEEPAQYQRGWVEFYKLRFKVTPDVLIPRPETELLVEQVIKMVNRLWFMADSKSQNTTHNTPPTIRILDVGTGSGNIAISIAKNLPNVLIVATEVSKGALKIAKQNAKLHGVQDRIEFVLGDLLENISPGHPEPVYDEARPWRRGSGSKPQMPKQVRHDNYFDIIVTNLPYIPSLRIDYLDSSVKDFEPRVALDGGQDGFELYRRLFAQIISKNLYPNFLIGEIDYTHGELAVNEANKYFPKCDAEVKLDLTHKQRFLVVKY